jgi:nucleoside-diphosphate-sugar epimerase
MPRAVVTGGGGFLGFHLCAALCARGWDVVAVDNFLTGRRENVADLAGLAGFRFVEHDVIHGIPVTGAVDAVLHFASPASVSEYLAHPIETLEVGSIGTRYALDLAHANEARFLLASTSEIYGDPLIHPQTEDYLGNVSCVGPRAVYDEAKRYAEAITMAYHRLYGLDAKIARIFNTFGPRLQPGDGRVVSNFLTQAISKQPLTVFGDGSQTRSFCYVDDEVAGLLSLLESDHVGPINIGSPTEISMLKLARSVLEVTKAPSEIIFHPLPVDDPKQRKPDITLARRVLGWSPKVDLHEGLTRTYEWYLNSANLGTNGVPVA